VAGGKIEARVVVIMVLAILVALKIECLMSAVYELKQIRILKFGCGSSIGAAELRVQSRTTVFSIGRAARWQEIR
jgi:hypothetical protein